MIIIGCSYGHALCLARTETVSFQKRQILIGVHDIIVNERHTAFITKRY